MAKANADYEKLLRYAKADLDAFKARLDVTGSELARLLAKVPERERIMQLLSRHGQNVTDHAAAVANVDRYQRLSDTKHAAETDDAAEASSRERSDK